MKRIFTLILAVLMIAAIAGGCSKKSASDAGTADEDKSSSSPTGGATIIGGDGGKTEPEAGKDTVHPSLDAKLSVAFHAEPGGLTQAGHAFASNMNHSIIFSDCLVDWDSSTGTPVPNVATEWEWLDDTTLRMKLRDDVTSIAGDPLTAHDVIYTWNLNKETTTLASYYNFFDYEKTKAVDDYTVDIALKAPYPFLLVDLAHYCYSLVVEKSMEAIGVEQSAYDPSAQIGPYKLTKWETGQCVYAERRDDYWGTMPYYKYMELWTVNDANTRAMGVEAGDYDVAINPTISSTVAAQGTPGVTGWFTGEGGAVTDVGLSFNSANEYLKIKENRQAIALAVNYDSLVQVALSGNGMTNDNAIVSSTSAYYTAPTDPEKCYYRYDPELAKQKLAESGNPDGFTISCKYSSGDAMIQATAELIQNQLKQVGIILDLQPLEKATLSSETRNGNYDSLIAGGGNPNPKRNFTGFDPRETYNSANGGAGPYWYDGDLDKLYELFANCLTTLDDAKRTEYFTQMNDILVDYCPKVYLYSAYKYVITSDEIVGFKLISMGAVNLKTVHPADYLAG